MQGWLFHKEWDAGRLSVTVEAREGHLKLREGERELTLSYGALSLDWGGATGKMVYFRHGDFPGTVLVVEDATILARLAQNGTPDLRVKLKDLETRRKKKHLTRWGWIAGFVALLLVGAWAFFGAVERATEIIPFSVDESIGELAEKQMTGSMGVTLKDPVVVDAIEGIVERLSSHVERPGVTFHVKVVESDQVNAFALPGGFMVVFTGLIEKAETAEEVAAVLGHEMAHVTERHGLRRILGAVGVIAFVQLVLGDVAGASVAVQELFTLATINGYGRDQETEADLEGIALLHRAGIDPRGAIRFFQRLKDEETAVEKSGVLAWIGTHPNHGERIEALNRAIHGLDSGTWKALDVDWQDIRKRVGFRAPDTDGIPNDPSKEEAEKVEN